MICVTRCSCPKLDASQDAHAIAKSLNNFEGWLCTQKVARKPVTCVMCKPSVQATKAWKQAAGSTVLDLARCVVFLSGPGDHFHSKVAGESMLA